ncbi:hypothetical protein BH09ACT1_BH09ACT1_08080 [soil metagenome]
MKGVLVGSGVLLVLAVIVLVIVLRGAGASGEASVSSAADIAAAKALAASEARTTTTADDPVSGIAKTYGTSSAASLAQASDYAAYGFSQGFAPLDLAAGRLDTLLDGVVATGATVIRLDLPWDRVQAAGPTDFAFDDVLTVYRAAIAKGLTVLPVTSGMPDWAGQGYPAVSASYLNFAYHAGLELIPLGITTIELQNEPNLTGITPAQYTELVLIPGAAGFRQAGDALGATVTIVSGGLAPSATSGGHYSQLDFVKGIYAAGGMGYFDVLGTHPYTWPDDPTVASNYNWLKKTTELHELMVDNGDGAKKIWATEFGYPTNSGARGVSEAKQARYLEKGAAIWSSHSWAGLLVFYSYEDLTTDDSDPEHHFGVTASDGTPKPALRAVRGIIAAH